MVLLVSLGTTGGGRWKGGKKEKSRTGRRTSGPVCNQSGKSPICIGCNESGSRGRRQCKNAKRSAIGAAYGWLQVFFLVQCWRIYLPSSSHRFNPWVRNMCQRSERVTGRKARGLQTEETACKCQTLFSLLSSRRKLAIFFPSLYTFKRFLLKYCVAIMTPGFTWS